MMTDKSGLEERLERLTSAQLLRRANAPEETYSFKHALTQETAYQSLLVKKRREIHRRVAEAYEVAHADGLDEFAALLAQHYAEAGDDVKTLDYALRAGDAAARMYANTEAVAHYALAIEMALKNPQVEYEMLAEVYLKRGRCLELLSNFKGAAQNYDEMAATANGSGNRAFQLAALTARATIRSIPGAARDPDQARVLCQEALELARRLGDRKTEAKILWNLVLINIYSAGDPHEAVTYGEQSLAIARELNLREQIAYTVHDLFVAYAEVGDMDRAVQADTESIALWRELHNLPMLAESLAGLGIAYYIRSSFDKAFPFLEEAYQIALSIGNLGGQAFSSYVSALICIDLGEISRATQYLEQSKPIIEHGALEGVGLNIDVQTGWVHALLGDYDGAREHLRRSLVRPWEDLPLQQAWSHAVRARIELLAGNIEEAKSLFRERQVTPSLTDFARMFPPGGPIIYYAAAELALACGESQRALELMDELLGHVNRIGMPFARPTILYLRGQALLLQGAPDAAIENWQQAQAEAQAMNARMILWQILAALATVHAERGDQEQAQALKQEAQAVARYIADHAPTALQATFLSTARVRAVLDT